MESTLLAKIIVQTSVHGKVTHIRFAFRDWANF